MIIYIISIIIILIIIVYIILIKKNKISRISKIPKIIYQTYIDEKEIPSDIIKCSKKKLIKNNPDYKYKFYNNNDIKKYILNNWGDKMLNIYESINKSYGAARADLFRYLILYDKGGVYFDIKSTCNKKLDKIIDSNDEFILCHWGDFWKNNSKPWSKVLNNDNGEFINWFIACKPKHIFLKKVIDNIVNKIINIKLNKIKVRGKKDVLFITGPVIYSKTILDILRNKNIKNIKNIKIYKNFKLLGLVYSCQNHIKLFKNHYSFNKDLIINI